MEQTTPNKRKYKKVVIIVISIVLLVLLGFSGRKGYRYAEKYLNALKGEKEKAIERVIDSMTIEVGIRDFQLDSIKSIKEVKIPNYWRKFKNSENEKEKLIEYILNLDSNIYTKSSLDSLAKYYKY